MISFPNHNSIVKARFFFSNLVNFEFLIQQDVKDLSVTRFGVTCTIGVGGVFFSFFFHMSALG